MGAQLQAVRYHSWFVLGVLAMLLPAAASAAEPVASTDGEQPGIRLDVTELKRTSGDTVMLKFTIVNEADERLGVGHDFGDPNQSSDYGTVGGIHLVDAGNKKKYLVVRDSDGKCLCSADLDDIEAGDSRALWAKFPAPPADVQQIGIVIPHFIPLDDVPIGQ
jgi:hypothetical protein